MSSFWQRWFGSGQSTPDEGPASPGYRGVIDRTAGMIRDRGAQALARRHHLQILDVTWEDTGRYKGSSVGPNISDMTIQVQDEEAHRGLFRLTCMPVVRAPNFSDRSADVRMDEFFLRVGNERGGPLRRVSLRDYLGDLRRYLHDPGSWAGEGRSLLAGQDTDVLVSAQACFLPVPRAGEAEFNPVLFNYQSSPGAPAVLAITATREGTSATVIDNARDGFAAGHTWGQRLFFNKRGQRCSLTGTRSSDFTAAGGDDGSAPPDAREGDAGLNTVLLIQVPLVQLRPRSMGFGGAEACLAMPMAARRSRGWGSSDVEAAVIGHGKAEGPFTEIAGLPIERDVRFPVRVTVQLYKATSNGVVSAADMEEIADQIERTYADARYVGSLVTEGETGRSTEWDAAGGEEQEPSGWWEAFWQRQEAATGRSRLSMMRDLERLTGRPFAPRSEDGARAVIRAARHRGIPRA